MKTSAQRPTIIRNQKGILTLDFIFAILMMFAFSAILFGFTITFSAVEIAQYITFASARAHFAANKNTDEQEKLGKDKFDELARNRNSILGTFFRNGWFELGDVKIADFNGEYGVDESKDSDTFIGARATFTAKILNMRFPLLGKTTDDDLTANISSFLGREPTEEECMQFMNERFERIQALKSGFTQFADPSLYVKIADDGC
jgi:hypothetical protein